MILQRLRRLLERFWLGRLLISLSIVFRMWLKSRNFKRLLLATPALVLTFAFAWAVSVSYQRNRDPALLEHYLTLARKAATEGDVKDTRLLFRRAQQLAPADRNITTELASSLFTLGERAEAWQMLSSLAPVEKSGHLPAHRFLVQHPPDLEPVQKDHFQAVHLSHLVRNSAETRAERVQLLHILARYRKLNVVEQLIRDALDRYPEDRLFLAQLKYRNGDLPGARRETEEACRAFSVLVEEQPQNADHRVQLAQGYVFLLRFAEAICVLTEGMAGELSQGIPVQPSVEPKSTTVSTLSTEDVEDRNRKLASTLSNIYFAWMITLPANEQELQLRCLQRILNPETSTDSVALLPAELNAKMQTALQSPATSWVLSVLEGNARVALGEWSKAEVAYRFALKSAPNDPTLANNLAYVVLKKSRSVVGDGADETRQGLLQEAIRLSDNAVNQMPEILNFLETRGQIHAALGNHAAALVDLNECLKRGKDTPEIKRTIEASARALR